MGGLTLAVFARDYSCREASGAVYSGRGSAAQWELGGWAKGGRGSGGWVNDPKFRIWRTGEIHSTAQGIHGLGRGARGGGGLFVNYL